MNKKKVIIGIVIWSMSMLTGCSALSLGHEEGSCEEQGLDFSDAGYCGDPIYIVKNREKIKKQVYKDFYCKAKK